MEKLMAHQTEAIPELAGAPDSLQDVYARMVAKKVDERYQSMAEVIAGLEACKPELEGIVAAAGKKTTGMRQTAARGLSETVAIDQATDPNRQGRKPGKR